MQYSQTNTYKREYNIIVGFSQNKINSTILQILNLAYNVNIYAKKNKIFVPIIFVPIIFYNTIFYNTIILYNIYP